MALPIVALFQRRYFARAFSNGETFDNGSLDASLADLVEGHNQVKSRLDAISTSAGSLKYALVSITSFTATASQTAFTVTTYDNTAGASFVLAFTDGAAGTNLLAIPQASITQTSTTSVTLPAQTVNAKVMIAVYGSGNGTSQLASTSAGQGASLIGIADAGAYITATTVEGALQEIAANLASSSYIGGVLTLTNYIKKDGSVTFTAAQSMGGFKLTNLAAGSAASNDAARMNDITAAALTTTMSAYLSANYLALTGGTLTGTLTMAAAISMGTTNKITLLANGTVATDAVNYGQLQALDGAWLTTGTIAAARLPTFVKDNGAVVGVQGAVPASSIGDAAALKFLCADATWRVPTTASGSGYILLQDQKPNNTSAGGSAAGMQTRTLNTEVVDTGSYCTLAANQFALLAGTYRITARAPALSVNNHVAYLYNVTDAAVTVSGTPEWSSSVGAYASNWSHIFGRFTIASTKTFEIRHNTAVATATTGLGGAANIGQTEIYTTVELIRE